jgi:hypothetical protein
LILIETEDASDRQALFNTVVVDLCCSAPAWEGVALRATVLNAVVAECEYWLAGFELKTLPIPVFYSPEIVFEKHMYFEPKKPSESVRIFSHFQAVPPWGFLNIW